MPRRRREGGTHMCVAHKYVGVRLLLVVTSGGQDHHHKDLALLAALDTRGHERVLLAKTWRDVRRKKTRPTYCNYYDNAEKEKHDLLSWESFDGGCERELHRGHKMYK